MNRRYFPLAAPARMSAQRAAAATPPAIAAGLPGRRRPALESAGDWELVSELARSAMARGSSAARQRAARGSGGLRAVVDTLIAGTRAVPPWLQGARRVA
jgi:hypothetical protein